MHRRLFTLRLASFLGLNIAGTVYAQESTHQNTAPQPTLAHPYRDSVNLHDYWVSEKYDGVRGLWNGSQLYSRQGLPIQAPDWFTQGWPRVALDGELWAGRGQFIHAQSTVAKQVNPDDTAWRQMRFMVFDAPETQGNFSERLSHLQKAINAANIPWLVAAPQWRVNTHAELMHQLQKLSREGGEGLMLRRESAPYRAGRSDDLLKFKLFDDAEAVVIAHLPGKGKYTGMTGALLVEMPSGLRFQLGSGLTDAERRNPPPIGSTVTYRFNDLHPSGLPRFARYWRIREEPGMQPPKAQSANQQSAN